MRCGVIVVAVLFPAEGEAVGDIVKLVVLAWNGIDVLVLEELPDDVQGCCRDWFLAVQLVLKFIRECIEELLKGALIGLQRLSSFLRRAFRMVVVI